MLAALAVAELLAMAPWFSASAVAPTLVRMWRLTGTGAAWLTISVQLGFVAGAVTSAALTLADRWSARRLVAGAAALAVRSTAAGREPFTALSLVPAGDRAVVLTVKCEEDGPVGYSLRVQGDDGYQQTFVVTLQPGSTWSRTLDVPRTGTVTADLFKGTTAVPYRTVHLAGGR